MIWKYNKDKKYECLKEVGFMYPGMDMIRCTIMRGGTSKGIFLMAHDLPTNPSQQDDVILQIFGTPDIRQIDGLGGGDLLTSKCAIIGPSSRPDADVDYTFAQVALDKALVNRKGNCGNIAAAVGPFAIHQGLVPVTEPVTTVRIHLTNSHNIVTAEIPVANGEAVVDGELHIDGVPGTGAKIILDWKDGQGAFTGKMLPTGHVSDVIEAGGRNYHVSIFDVGNPLVFVPAGELNLTGLETPKMIESNPEVMALLEEIRGKAAEKIGMVQHWQSSVQESGYVPFIALVSPPAAYETFDGKQVEAKDVDVVSRLLFMQQVHKSYPVTSTVTLAIAAKIPGTVVSQVVRPESKQQQDIRIGHPAGVIPAESMVDIEKDTIVVRKAAMYRTARLIMDGYVYVRQSQLGRT